MGLRKILTDKDPALHKVCRSVTKFDNKLHELLDDMTETMNASGGVGLAAVQVGMLRRVVVIDVKDGKGTIELVNPEIVSFEGNQSGNEGCLSLPGSYQPVDRPYRVTIKAQDRNGEEFTMTGEGLLARAFCHEIEHLDGILFIDHVEKPITSNDPIGK